MSLHFTQCFLKSDSHKIFLLFITISLVNPRLCSGQQNLFNIPSGDITNEKKLFYQHQLNLYGDKIESKAHFVYGLGKGWDVGLNVVGKGAYFSPSWRVSYNDNPDRGALYPIVLATVQKQIQLTEQIDFNLGSQVGYNISNQLENKELNYFSYGIGIYHLPDHNGRLVGGVYQTNRMYVGEGNIVGLMLGYEIKLSKRWYLMGDWVSGDNDAAVGVVGGIYNLSRRVQLCSGWQIPNPESLKPSGIVFELNVLGWDMEL